MSGPEGIQTEPLIGGHEIFLDSDDLQDLTKLLNHVVESEVLIVMQTSEVIARPWMILELHTAVTHDIPIVALFVRGKGYDFMKSMQKGKVKGDVNLGSSAFEVRMFNVSTFWGWEA